MINELGLPAGTIEILSTGKGILEFITFMVYCYGSLLVHSQLPMCVKLISVMDNFIKQNSQFSMFAIKVFGNHMCYLTK